MTTEALAIRAAEAWGGTAHPPRLLSHRENAVFEVTLPSGLAALRLHRPGYRTDSHIRSELDWTNELAMRGFPAPEPVAMSGGDYLLALDNRLRASVIVWMDGAPIGTGSSPLTADDLVTYFEVGALLARLHRTTMEIGPKRFDRPSWDIDGLTGPRPLWGRYWDMPGLSVEQRRLLIAARDRARSQLVGYAANGGEITLIHSDALRENVFRRPDGSLALIDFDDSGFGFVMYELAASISQAVTDPLYPMAQRAVIEGYSKERPLTPCDRSMFGVFAMLRAFSSLGWTVPRLRNDHPKLSVYIERACMLAAKYLMED